jgi:hypothetical protein
MKRLLPLGITTLALLGFSPIASAATPAPSMTSDRTVTQHVSRRTLRAQTEQAYAERAAFWASRPTLLEQTYANAQYGVQVRYPKGWEESEPLQTEDNLTLVFVLLSPLTSLQDGVRENINLVVEDTKDSPLSLDRYTALGLEREQEFFDTFRLIDSVPATLGGQPAHRVTYTATKGNLTLKYRQIWLFKDHLAYVWTFADRPASFDDHVRTFDQMLGTFQLQ